MFSGIAAFSCKNEALSDFRAPSFHQQETTFPPLDIDFFSINADIIKNAGTDLLSPFRRVKTPTFRWQL
jgi:hypothetical protein